MARAALSAVSRIYIFSPTTRAYLEPWETQVRVHSAGVPSMCFLPHMASPTSPVKVCLRPVAAYRLETIASEKMIVTAAVQNREPRFIRSAPLIHVVTPVPAGRREGILLSTCGDEDAPTACPELAAGTAAGDGGATLYCL